MRQPEASRRPAFSSEREGPASGTHAIADAEPGARELRDLLACLCDSACVGERLGLVARFAQLAARSDIGEGLRQQALRVVQDLAKRKHEEAACVRGLEVMKGRVKARAKR